MWETHEIFWQLYNTKKKTSMSATAQMNVYEGTCASDTDALQSNDTSASDTDALQSNDIECISSASDTGVLKSDGLRADSSSADNSESEFEPGAHTGEDDDDSLLPGYKASSSKTITSGNSKYMVSFKKYLGSAAGGKKGEREIGMTASVVLRYMRFAARRVLGENSELSLPAAIKTDYIIFKHADKVLRNSGQYSQWIGHLEREKSATPATIKAHLNRLRRYVEYRMMQITDDDDHESAQTMSKYQGIIQVLRQHGRNLSQQARKDQGERFSKEALLARGEWCSLPDVVAAFRVNEPEFKKWIGIAKKDSSKLSYEGKRFCLQFVNVSCYVLCSPARIGFWKSITVKDFRKSCQRPDRLLSSTKFKTSATYGYQSIIIHKNFERVIGSYIKYVRPHCGPDTGPLDDSLFVGIRSGKQLKGTAEILKQFFQRALGVNIHSTRLRQILHTGAVENFTVDDVTAFERGDTHSSTVARLHYLKQSSSSVAKHAGALQRQLVQAVSPGTGDASARDHRHGCNASSSGRSLTSVLPKKRRHSVTGDSSARNTVIDASSSGNIANSEACVVPPVIKRTKFAVIEVSSSDGESGMSGGDDYDYEDTVAPTAARVVRSAGVVSRNRISWTKEEVLFVDAFVRKNKNAKKQSPRGGMVWNWALAVRLGSKILQKRHRQGTSVKDCARNIEKGVYAHYFT